jgi:hypothetical protein
MPVFSSGWVLAGLNVHPLMPVGGVIVITLPTVAVIVWVSALAEKMPNAATKASNMAAVLMPNLILLPPTQTQFRYIKARVLWDAAILISNFLPIKSIPVADRHILQHDPILHLQNKHKSTI